MGWVWFWEAPNVWHDGQPSCVAIIMNHYKYLSVPIFQKQFFVECQQVGFFSLRYLPKYVPDDGNGTGTSVHHPRLKVFGSPFTSGGLRYLGIRIYPEKGSHEKTQPRPYFPLYCLFLIGILRMV